jgi:hypothetical protein
MAEREIKFRAWDNNNDSWCAESELWINGNGKIEYAGSPLDGNDDIEIELLAGIKDKNKTETYEGDVIRQEREDSFSQYNTGEVVYDETRACFLVRYFKRIPENSFLRKLSKGGDVITDTKGNYLFNRITAWPFEIIGTIHDKEQGQ